MVQQLFNRLNNRSAWTYQDTADDAGFGPATKHHLQRDDGTCIVVALSEGGHIMACKRGDWLVKEQGPDGMQTCKQSESDALIAAADMANWLDLRDEEDSETPSPPSL